MMPTSSFAQSVQPRGFPRGPLAPGITMSYPGLAFGTLFDGVNDFAEVTSLGLSAPNEFTAMGWVVANALPNSVILDTTTGVGLNGFSIAYDNNLSVLSFGTGATRIDTFRTFTIGRRYHVAIVATAGTLTVYIDGAPASAATSVPIANRPSSYSLHRFGTNTSGGQPWSGRLTCWSIYTRALLVSEIETAARIRAIYPSLDRIVAMYPFDQLGPTATQSPDISGFARHLALLNMPANPIVSF
jgi:hypothetical protein